MNAIRLTFLLITIAAFAANPPGLAYQLTHAVTVDPSFSPDGARMVYITVVAGKEQLFTANADATKPLQITHDEWSHEDPAWSPDGRKIAFVSMKDGGEVISMRPRRLRRRTSHPRHRPRHPPQLVSERRHPGLLHRRRPEASRQE